MRVQLDAVENEIKKEAKVATKAKKKRVVSAATREKLRKAALKRPRYKDGGFKKGSAAKAGKKKKSGRPSSTRNPVAKKKAPSQGTGASPNKARPVGSGKKKSPAKKKGGQPGGARNVVGFTAQEITLFIVFGAIGWILIRLAADAATTIARKMSVLKPNPTGDAKIAIENENMLRIIRMVTRGVLFTVAILLVLRMKGDSARDIRKRSMSMGLMTGAGMATVLATMEDLTTMAFRGIQDSDTRTLMQTLFRSDQNIPESMMGPDAGGNPLWITGSGESRHAQNQARGKVLRTRGTTFAPADRTQGRAPGFSTDPGQHDGIAKRIINASDDPAERLLPDTASTGGVTTDLRRIAQQSRGSYVETSRGYMTGGSRVRRGTA